MLSIITYLTKQFNHIAIVAFVSLFFIPRNERSGVDVESSKYQEADKLRLWLLVSEKINNNKIQVDHFHPHINKSRFLKLKGS